MKAACTRHTALLLHRMTHNHSPKIRELATIGLRTKQVRNTCPRWILHRTGMPTDTGIRIWNHLQRLFPTPHPAILTTCVRYWWKILYHGHSGSCRKGV